eukprot:1186343-Prorocentrum_minimum.AAC.3
MSTIDVAELTPETSHAITRCGEMTKKNKSYQKVSKINVAELTPKTSHAITRCSTINVAKLTPETSHAITRCGKTTKNDLNLPKFAKMNKKMASRGSFPRPLTPRSCARGG